MKSVWYRAAELTLKRIGPEMHACCLAIERANGSFSWELNEKFISMFRPLNAGIFWWGFPEPNDQKAITARCIALLLMDLIEQDEQRERKP